MSKDLSKAIVAFVLLILVALIVFYFFTPDGRRELNRREEAFAIADNETKYETMKMVEDTARTMVVSYEADKLYWQQYKDSENAKEREWAGQAKHRANKTAVSYNEYILKNSRVWDGNVPKDILRELPVLGGSNGN